MQTQIILAGVGGQGILFASKLFSELGLKLGLNVISSETHGMSQRGGSVIAHLKLGDFYGPLIMENSADILYSFEKNETYKTLKFLQKSGVCFANTVGKSTFDKKILSHLKEKGIIFKTFDANSEALKIGSALTTNIVLIGYSVGTGLIPFECKDIKETLESISKKKFIPINMTAFDRGFQLGCANKLNSKE